jgi:hypothetical protein
MPELTRGNEAPPAWACQPILAGAAPGRAAKMAISDFQNYWLD